MTNSLTSETSGQNLGAYQIVEATVSISSLQNAGAEPWNPNSELADVDDYSFVVVTDYDAGYNVVFDHANDQFLVKYADYDAAADGVLIDVPSATAVGDVDVVVFGRR